MKQNDEAYRLLCELSSCSRVKSLYGGFITVMVPVDMMRRIDECARGPAPNVVKEIQRPQPGPADTLNVMVRKNFRKDDFPGVNIDIVRIIKKVKP